ncbi:PPE family protein, partial [Mycobacterium shimoidei]
MTAPVWMASPPEVHSALLSSGPGPEALLAAAGAWKSLSTEYAAVADELTALLGRVQAASWEGPTAESYVAANVPFLAWLTQASAHSSVAAVQHETLAAAYTAALAAMPTLAELATNHAVHAVLVATNFFGINTIPIALNEADYVRMWVQAATTMATYQAVSGAAVASVPPTEPAPPIEKSDASALHSDDAPDPTVDNPVDDLIANILKNFGVNWDPANGTVNGLPYDSYTDPSQPLFWVVRTLEFGEDFQQVGQLLMTNPGAAFQYLVQLALFDWPTHIAEIATGLSQNPALLAVAAGAAVAPAGSVGGIAGLAGLAGLPQATVPPAVAPAPVATSQSTLPVAGTAPTVAATAAAPAASSAPAPTATVSTVAGPTPPAPPPTAAGGAGFLPPYVIGPPGIGSSSRMSAAAGSSAKRKAPEPDTAAASASARREARARRRRRAPQRAHGDQFADMNVAVDPQWATVLTSDAGAGSLGFSGNGRGPVAVGLARLAGDEFGVGPGVPMLPGS